MVERAGGGRDGMEEMWRRYAGARFRHGEQKRRWRQLYSEACAMREELAAEAQVHGGRLGWNEGELVELALRALDAGCEYCGRMFGLGSWGAARRDPLRLVNAGNAGRASWGLAAYAVCCAACAGVKRRVGFSDAELCDVLAALRRCDESVELAAIAALAGGGEGTSHPLRPASNASGAGSR